MACRFEAYLFIQREKGTGGRKGGRDYFVCVLLYFLFFLFLIYIDPTHKASVQFYHQWRFGSKYIFLFDGKRERERGRMVVIISCAYYSTLPFYILFFYLYRSKAQGKRVILPSMACRFEAYLFIQWEEGTGGRKGGRDYLPRVLLHFTFLFFYFQYI